MDTHEEDCALLRETKLLLLKSNRTYLQIYQDTGLDPNWLSSVLKGRTKNPSVNRIQKLYEYLSGRTLVL